MTPEERAASIPRFKPELASMNTGSINWGLFPVAEKIKEFKYDWERPNLQIEMQSLEIPLVIWKYY